MYKASRQEKGESKMNRFLSKKHMERIHDRSLHLLETVGVQIHHENALRQVEKAGASVDRESACVRFSRNMVEENLELAPKEFILAGRNPNNDLVFPLPETEFYTRTNTGAPHYVIPRTNEYQEIISLSEIKNWIRLADALGNVDLICSPFPGDVPPKTSDLYAMKTMLENTEKHFIVQPYSEESLPYIAEMACTAAGGKAELKRRPITSIFSCSLSPLVYTSMHVEIMRIGAEYGIPVQIASLPALGGTSPVTLAGIILLANVEFLAGNVITQVFNPGTPVIYVAHKFSLDMANGNFLAASVEAMMAAVAHAEFVKEQYKIPFQTIALIGDSYLPDGQSMAERAFAGLLVGMGRAEIIAGLGSVAGANAVNLSQLVIDNDIIGMIRKVRRGIEWNDENLAWEVISEVGPGGQFVDHDHTYRHFREAFQPRTFNRKTREAWLSEGKRDIVDNANDIVDELLKLHEVSPLPNEMGKQLKKIVKAADGKLSS
jgi:trimethylamine--corrinoid protein Co-methyltransferase